MATRKIATQPSAVQALQAASVLLFRYGRREGREKPSALTESVMHTMAAVIADQAAALQSRGKTAKRKKHPKADLRPVSDITPAMLRRLASDGGSIPPNHHGKAKGGAR